jgi:hypothetical protein
MAVDPSQTDARTNASMIAVPLREPGSGVRRRLVKDGGGLALSRRSPPVTAEIAWRNRYDVRRSIAQDDPGVAFVKDFISVAMATASA